VHDWRRPQRSRFFATVSVMVADGWGNELCGEAPQAGGRISQCESGGTSARAGPESTSLCRLGGLTRGQANAMRNPTICCSTIFQEVSLGHPARRGDLQNLVESGGECLRRLPMLVCADVPGRREEKDKGTRAVGGSMRTRQIRDLRVEPRRYPEIQEAIRTAAATVRIPDVHEHPLFEVITPARGPQPAHRGLKLQ